MHLPNIKKLFLPEPGNVLCDVDLMQADVRAMAWDADAKALKKILLDPTRSLHLVNAQTIYGPEVVSKKDPRYKKAKAGIHATDYGCKPPKLSKVLGCSRAEATEFQRKWFGAHPELPRWQARILHQLTHAPAGVPALRNPFGLWMPYFDRPDSILPQALAWGPQSVVALVINQGLINLAMLGGWKPPAPNPPYVYKIPDKVFPSLTLNLQVHDSLVFQYPAELDREIRPLIHKALQITVPYPDPLIIPLEFACSTQSYGHCANRDWDDFSPLT